MAIEQLHSETSVFEQLYLAVRQHEARVYTDEEVMRLPQTSQGHPHEQEWEIRRRSAKRLIARMHGKHRPLKILEIGCGNGWLSAELGYLPQSTVVGIDVNQVEIEQAQRVFKAPNLKFICSAFDAGTFTNEKFDMIVFAAVLPYFKSVSQTLNAALGLLRPGGEVHIVDTHFYDGGSIETATDRCREYYIKMGLPEMAEHYYHHKLDELSDFQYRLLIDPRSVLNRLFKKEPFYWVVIQQEAK